MKDLLLNVGSGGGAAAAPGGVAASGGAGPTDTPAEEPKKEEKEEGKLPAFQVQHAYADILPETEKEESDEDMGFGLFD